MLRVVFQDQRFEATYSQVGLYDAEDPVSYPQWDTGDEAVAIGPKGVAVAAWWGTSDIDVAVTFWEGPGDPGIRHVCTTTIAVGGAGLRLGIDYEAAVPWPPGETRVSAYVDTEEPKDIRRVDFVLERLIAP